MDGRDWLIAGLVTAFGIVGTIYLFTHPSDMNFATWQLFCGALFGTYHWIKYRDDKIPDASQGAQYYARPPRADPP